MSQHDTDALDGIETGAVPSEQARAEQAAQAALVPTTPGAKYRVDLGDGEWADLRDPAELKAIHRKQVIAQIDEGTAGRAAMAATDGVAAVMIVAWSLPLPIPSRRIEALDELTIEQDDALQAHPAMQEATTRLVRRQVKPEDPSEDPASPTSPSSGSARY